MINPKKSKKIRNFQLSRDKILQSKFVEKLQRLCFFWGTFVILFASVGCSQNKYPLQINPGSSPTDSISNLPKDSAILPGLQKFSLPQLVEGVLQERTYLVRFPLKPSSSNYPIVFYFHGGRGTAFKFFRNLGEVHRLIDDNQFIGIFPQGFRKSWNLSLEPSKADDVAWVTEIFEEISKLRFVDSSSVYAVGISNGAGLVNKLGKETEIFNGIAPIVSQQTVKMLKVTPHRGISVFQVNGDNDPLVPLEGGLSRILHKFVSAKESAQNWARYSNCAEVPTRLEENWGPFRTKGFIYDECESGRQVRYHVVQGSGHRSYFKGFPLHTVIWNFFKNSPGAD